MGILAAISVTKKLLLAALLIVFAMFILGASLQSTNADNSSFTTPMAAQQPMQKLILNEVVPGNPLYALRMIGDRVRLELTFNPVENAWLRVEYANRRLETATLLLKHDEELAAINTMAKAEIYLGKAAELLNTHDRTQLAKLQPVLLEHRRQLEGLKSILHADSEKTRVDQLINYNASLYQTISRQ